MRDKHTRSILKAIIYRCMGIGLLAGVSWFATQSLEKVTWITAGYHAVSICGYYAYERIWERVRWGRHEK